MKCERWACFRVEGRKGGVITPHRAPLDDWDNGGSVDASF